MIAVSIVEDNPDIRNGLKLIIDGTPGFRCSGAYEDGEEALTHIPLGPPDIVLMDIKLPGMSGIECVRQLKRKVPELELIMLTAHEDDIYVFDSLCAGASGYVLKETAPSKLLDAIRQTCAGGAPLSDRIARRVVRSFRNTPRESLTDREREVLTLLCQGKSYKMIADALFVGEETVRSHIKKIYQKLDVHSKSGAVARAMKDGLVFLAE